MKAKKTIQEFQTLATGIFDLSEWAKNGIRDNSNDESLIPRLQGLIEAQEKFSKGLIIEANERMIEAIYDILNYKKLTQTHEFILNKVLNTALEFFEIE